MEGGRKDGQGGMEGGLNCVCIFTQKITDAPKMIFDLPWCRSKPPLETPTTHCSASQSSYETPPGTPRAGPAPAPPSSDGGKPQPGAHLSLNTSGQPCAQATATLPSCACSAGLNCPLPVEQALPSSSTIVSLGFRG